MSDSITQNQPQTDKPQVATASEEQNPLVPVKMDEPPVSPTPDSMTELQPAQVDQLQVQAGTGGEGQTPPAPGRTGESPVSKKKLKIPKIKMFGGRFRIVAAVILGIVLGSGYFLLKHRGNLLKEGKKVIGHVVAEKAKDSLKKSEGPLTAGAKASQQEKATEESKIEQKKSIAEQPGKKDGKDGAVAKQVDNAKYIIEADKLFEQGEYERAVPLYEKGMNKLMPFLNEENVTYRLGECYLRSEKYEEALKMFQTINSDYVNSPYQFKSRLKTGECYAGLGEFKKARKVLYTILAQEGKCRNDEDKSIVVDSYFKIADYYMQEAERLRKSSAAGTVSASRSLASK